MEQVKPVLAESNYKTGKSAALIGLAISVGASSLLLPQQVSSAVAKPAKRASAPAPTAANPTAKAPSVQCAAPSGTHRAAPPEAFSSAPAVPVSETTAPEGDWAESAPNPAPHGVQPGETVAEIPPLSDSRSEALEVPEVEGCSSTLTQVELTCAQPAVSAPATPDCVQNVRAQIANLRQKYREHKNSTEIYSNAGQSPAAVAQVTEAPESDFPEPVSSDLGFRRHTQRLQADLQRLREQNRAQVSETEAVPPAGEELATAPLGWRAYERLIPLESVSPELPPLSAPETYLPQGAAVSGFIWPALGEFTSGYGWRWGRMHRGIDIAAPIGTPIVAAADGVVTYAGWNEGGYGNLVEIQHPDGSVTLYAHNDRILVREGDRVQQGQQVAEMGTTGRSTGPHLHFEIHPPGQEPQNPLAYLPAQ